MGLQLIIDTMESTANADPDILSFTYGKMWDINGNRTKPYPRILVDSMPNFKTVKNRNGGRALKKEYKIKVWIFDTRLVSKQKSTPKLWAHQEELEIKFDNYLGDCINALRDMGNIVDLPKSQDGFHGWNESMNTEDLVIYQELININ